MTPPKRERGRTVPLIQGIKNDIREAKKIRIPWRGLLLWMAASFLCSLLFDGFGKLELVLPILNSIAVLGFTIALKRKLWRDVWFWITIAILAGIHVPLVVFIPWTSRWVPAGLIAVIDSADFCLMLWIISIMGKLVEVQKTSES